MDAPRHIVAVTALIRDESNRVLMIRSPQRGWEMPGGQVEEGESLTDAVQREVREETGMEVTANLLAGIYTNLTRSIVIFAFIGSPHGGTLQSGDESPEVVWLDTDEALRRITHAAGQVRFKDLCGFDGTIVYRTYRAEPFELVTSTTFA